MGRFSKLETGGRAGEARKTSPTAAEPGAGYPTADAPPERSDLDAAGCLRHGDEHLFRGERKLALRWYSRAMDKDSTLIEAWVALLRTLLLKGDLSEAGTWLSRGLTLFPNSPQLLALRAVHHARRGMMRQAINSSDAVLEQNGSEPLAHMARGEVLLLADNKNADFCFEQCLKLTRPDDRRTPVIIGLIMEERRLWTKAIQFYAQAAERGERRPALWYRVGLCRAELGQRMLARKAFQQARELCHPNDPLLRKIEYAAPGSIWKRVLHLFR